MSAIIWIYLAGAVVALLVAFFMEGLTGGDSDFFALLFMAALWPVALPIGGAYFLGSAIRERRRKSPLSPAPAEFEEVGR